MGAGHDVGQELGPLWRRPVLLFAAAARVDGEQRGGSRIGVLESQLRQRVGVEDGEALEGLEKDFGGVERLGFIRSVRAREELRLAASLHVLCEEAVGVVEVGDDDVEAGEVVAHRVVEVAPIGEEARERAGFDGTDGIGEAAVQGERGDVRVAEDFEMRVGEPPPQRREHRQREDEVPDGSAANDEDFAFCRHAESLAQSAVRGHENGLCLFPATTAWRHPIQSGRSERKQDGVTKFPAGRREQPARRGCHPVQRNTVAPSPATSTPSARRRAQPIFTRVSVAVFHSMRSRQRHGETVNQMPAIIQR